MKTGKRSGLCICAGLLTMALLSACGNSNSSAIPATASIFYAHTAVFNNTSTLLTTGYNGFGQLGNGNLTSTTVLAPVVGPVPAATLGRVSKVSLGADHTLALTSGSVYAWGSNYHGQIGNAAIAITGSTAYSSTPVLVTLSGTVTDIAAGGLHSLAVVQVNGVGNVYSWGYNGYGQLGNGNTQNVVNFTDTNVPVPIVPVDGAQLNVTNVAAGGTHSLARTADGKVYGWGNNTYGQAGSDPITLGGFLNTPGPTVVQYRTRDSATALGTLTQVTKIAAGGSSSYALDASGQVWAWGYNNSGQAGLDPTIAGNLYTVAAVPVAIPLALNEKVTQISAGLDHALALTSQGRVFAWGLNQFAQLGSNIDSKGNSDLVSRSTPVQVLGPDWPNFNPDLSKMFVNDIIAFGNYSLALVNGVWYGWGDNSYGQLANPVANNAIGYIPVPVKLAGFK